MNNAIVRFLERPSETFGQVCGGGCNQEAAPIERFPPEHSIERVVFERVLDLVVEQLFDLTAMGREKFPVEVNISMRHARAATPA
jgi:hypothetical protein